MADVDKPTVRQFSPILADVLAASTEQGIKGIAEKLLNVIFAPTSDSPSRKNPSVARRLIEILESHPDKTTFLDFIRFHLPRTGRYLGWGGELVLEKYEFDGMEFDAYAPYVGHGARLTLVSFTKICTISRIGLIQKRFKNDRQSQASLISSLVGSQFASNPDYFKSWVPNLAFFIFAGRRSKIDVNTVTHDTWSRLLKKNRNITIKTYDYILDAFLDHDGDEL